MTYWRILDDLHGNLASQQPGRFDLIYLEIWFLSGGFELNEL